MNMPADLLTQVPMAACKSKEPITVMLGRGDRYIYDVKWDGVRALLYVDSGKAKLRNRNGADITGKYPEIIAAAQQAYPTGQRVFDGELVVCNPQTQTFEFQLALKRDAQSHPTKIATMARRLPATYMAFDLLWQDGTDLRGRPLRKRLDALDGEALGPSLQRSLARMDGQLMWSAVEQFGFEGLIAKTLSSRYRGGDSPDWVKLKRLKRVTAIVSGYEPGEGGRANLVGALHLELLRDGARVSIGKVGTGFKRTDHAPMLEVLRAGEEFLVEVEYLGVSSDFQLRQPSYKGVRADVSIADCTVEQFT